ITDIISIVQYKGKTVHFENLGSPVALVYNSGDKNTFDSMWIGWSFRMLAVDCVIYLLLAWLAGQLVSSDASEGRSLFSVLVPGPLKRLLLGSGDVVQEGDIRGEERMKSREDGNVRAYKVSKTYGGVQALREVSFSMKRGEVFVMLGHNGAGKSTLINIITGVIAPTHGKVYIKGLDVENDVSEIQQTIGVCSQDDLLWDELTAKEHMLLTAAFKGLQWGPQLFAAVDNVLNTMQLLDRANNFCSQYSGGMKRR
ncbi:ABCA8, partial [Symbiodinium microadriaticum]